MGIAIDSKEDISETIDLLRRLVLRFIFPGLLNMAKREEVLNHLERMKRKRIFVECRFEVISELDITKFSFTITHAPQEEVRHHA